MTDLIRIDDNGGIKTVNARDLWTVLESKRQFANWIGDKLEGFIEGVDFTVNKFVNGKATQIDYHLTLDTAKHLAMLERNERGMTIRQYFIEVEKAAHALPQGQELLALAVVEAQRVIAEKQSRIAILEPKAAFFDQVADSKTAVTMRDAAAALNMPGWGRNKLFAFLRCQLILDDRNIPYREYQDRGYFRVIERSWTDDKGEAHVTLTTLIYQRGLDYIRKLVQAHQKVTA